MKPVPLSRRALAGSLGLALGAALLAPAVPAAAGQAARLAGPAAATAPPVDRTSPLERRRVDSVPTPKLGWYRCYGYAECATVKLPLDYDNPKGAKIELAVLRVKARNARQRIGSLFVNPGGPGGSAVQLAHAAPYFLGDEVLDRFDVVGVDPRGIGFSDQLKCFRNNGEQAAALEGYTLPFPYTPAEEKASVAAVKALGRACSTTGRRIAGAMSTAEVARDMDVLRRAVGDKKLTFLGFSYGSALGQYYANMFPDRVRAVAIDGVINPVAWVGTRATREIIQDDRLRSADGAYKALREILVRCDKAGGALCRFAPGNPVKNFDLIATRLKARPVVLEDEGESVTVTYAGFITYTLFALYSPSGYRSITSLAAELIILTEPPAVGAAKARRASAHRSALQHVQRLERAIKVRAQSPARDFPYDNSWEAYVGVACTDGLHPRDAALWPRLTDASDRRAPYFGKAWAWSTAPCARSTWTVRDEDAYRGPFTRRTSAPVLVVGNFWDPATNYQDAVTASRLLPNSRLLSSDSWGHTAYGTSECATRSVDAYLLKVALPPRGRVCKGDEQPFAGPSAKPARQLTMAGMRDLARAGLPARGAAKRLPPVASRLPLAR
jgi:pimeloyl-ACP methyl ester carboxylesterase